VSEKKNSRQEYGNRGYRDGNSGKSHAHPHDGILDRLFGVSRSSAQKRDTYDKGWREGRKERNR
jgi:ribosome modulation factor